MGLFDRWTSQKGKAAKSVSKAEKQADAQRQAFSSVPGSQAKPADTDKDKPKDSKVKPDQPVTKGSTDRAYRTLLYPIVTEKSNLVNGQYTFVVHGQASKVDVRNAVHQVYGVRPVAVNISNRAGKHVRYGRYSGQTSGQRKAVVTLPAGKTIDVNA